MTLIDESVDPFKALVDQALFDSILAKAILAIAAFASGAVRLGMATGAPLERLGEYAANRTMPNQIPGHPDLVAAKVRGVIKSDTFNNLMNMLGFNDQVAQLLVDVYKPVFSVGELLEADRRGQLKGQTLDQGLASLGYDAQQIQTIKALQYSLAGPQDVVQFVVREVYDKSKRTALNLDQNFPVDALPAFKAAGVSEQLARDIWAAHWALPSVGQAFEMFQRDVWPDDADAQLDRLLEAIDIAPAYREGLKQIAYLPVTRTDIRRMYQLDVYDLDEVITRLRHTGYSPADASDIAEFYRREKEFAKLAIDEELKGVSKTTVLQLFHQHHINRQDAFDFLRAINIGEIAADMILDVAEAKRLASDTDDTIQTIIDNFVLGNLSYDQAKRAIADLGLSDRRLARAQTKLQTAYKSAEKTPDLKTLQQLKQSGAISQELFIEGLSRLGLADVWIDALSK